MGNGKLLAIGVLCCAVLCCAERLLSVSLPLFYAAVRALALKQISTKDMLRVVLKEAGAGCMMGEQGGP